jgi:hypothetical protein
VKALHAFLPAVVAGFVSLSPPAVLAQEPQPDSAVDDCLAKARDKAAKEFRKNKGLTRVEARLMLETDAARCLEPTTAPHTAAFVGKVRTDLARFGLEFALGKRAPAAYQAAKADRERKLDAFRDDLHFHKALAKGDADGDLVPDDRDRCPRTRDGAPTDDAGCPTAAETPAPDGDPALFRRLVDGAFVLRNKSCDGAPAPLTPSPIRWGRSEAVEGIKMQVTQVGGMPEGCELFYELRLHFIDPVHPALAPDLDVSLVFREGEDLSTSPTIAEFGLPQLNPLSAGRARAIQAFLHEYPRVSWKVRAVNGNNLTSPWSEPIEQVAHPPGLP